MFNNIFADKKVLITGHNGFKGSWLTQWLTLLDAKIIGVSLKPLDSLNHWNSLNLNLTSQYITDINNYQKLSLIFKKENPEIVFHLAAQPIVREGFKSPLNTWATNVMGTANLLDCCRHSKSVKAVVVVTTDKCYENNESLWGYREDDKLGGKDPYSASKASSELVVQSFRNPKLNLSNETKYATARAGNVIGGGDWSQDRLIPDAIKSLINGSNLVIRSPNSTRPWQHVLDCLSGYLLLAQNLFQYGDEFARSWNFGPNLYKKITVEDILFQLKNHIPSINWDINSDEITGESTQLSLDSTLSRTKLGWEPVWNHEQSILKTADWYKNFLSNGSIKTLDNVDEYINEAIRKEIIWTKN